MPKITIKLDQDVLVALTKLIDAITHMFEHTLAFEVSIPTEDQDLADAWKESLLEKLNADCHYLLDLLEDQEVGEANNLIHLDEKGIQVTLRVASAIRLKLRNIFLEAITDEELQDPTFDIQSLPSVSQKPYTCYVFLAGLQETLIRALDPDIEA